MVGDDHRLRRDLDLEPGAGKFSAVKQAHHRRRRGNHRHPFAEGLLPADHKLQAAWLLGGSAEQAPEAAVMVKVPVAQDRRVDSIRVDTNKARLLARTSGV